ncbi:MULTISPECIES: hypothetical protein [unclassified Moraxella]|uniref:hypothetical protein n=1 Tax=unclassified Moraxella TaxID=2685852 RepID=UPI003AF4B474
MQPIFFSGSRSLVSLPAMVQQRIFDNILQKNFPIVIGDADGADSTLQAFFATQYYDLVKVFCAGGKCRNNIGNWQIQTIASSAKGRAFYTAKDVAMANVANYGFVLWDGQSIGSLNNIAELLKQNKPSLVYFEPNQQFIKVVSEQDLNDLLQIADKGLANTIIQKGSTYLKQLSKNGNFYQQNSLWN